jgi:hypothetical protein
MMSSTPHDQTERLVQFSRRQLWLALTFLLLLGAAHLLGLFGHTAIPAVAMVPILVAVFFGTAYKSGGIHARSDSAAMKALRNDELRQLAQAAAFRNGFFALLAFPPACAFLLTWLGTANPLPVVVGGSVWLGAVVFLSSLLWHDR